MGDILKKMLVAAFFALVAGCATLSPHQEPPAEKKSLVTWEKRATALSNIQSWNLKGALAARNSENAFSANWQWNQTQKNYTIALFGPLASGSLQLTGSPNSVLLETSDGKKLTATTPKALLEQQLGWRLPVSSLYYWVRGLPVPGIPAQKQLDAANRLSVLLQQGWRIEYMRYSSVKQMDLPSKMLLNNAALNVKIIINQWQF